MNEKFEGHYKAIKEIFDKYKKEHRNITDAHSSMVKEYESPIDKLKKLKELIDLGIISEDEYEEKREKMLSEI